MFRKCFAAFVAMMFVVGGLFADEIKGVFKKVDSGKVTVEVDGKATDYKVGDVKVKVGKKGEQTEVPLVDALGKWKDGQNGIFTVEKGEVINAKKEKKK